MQDLSAEEYDRRVTRAEKTAAASILLLWRKATSDEKLDRERFRRKLAAAIFWTRQAARSVGAASLGVAFRRDLATTVLDSREATALASSFVGAAGERIKRAAAEGTDSALADTRIKLAPRLETIAVTETNQIVNEARERAVLESLHKFRLVRGTWDAERDDHTCPVCRGLDGATRIVGSADYPSGERPGWVHPRCRCRESFEFIE